VNIHNQCSGFKLTNENYLSSDIIWNRYLGQEVGAGDMMSVDFKPSSSASEGILMYELEREDIESDDQSKSTYLQLCITWNFKGYKELRVFVHLIENEKCFFGIWLN
jgi:hypothetical protein